MLQLTTPDEARSYRELTYPHYRPLMDRLGNDTTLVALAAGELGRPSGLALAQLDERDPTTGIVRSIYVVPHARGNGIATALLKRTEALLQARDCRRASLVYPLGKPTTPALQRVLSKCGWASPQRSMLLAHMPIATVREAPRSGLAPLPEPFRTVPWIQLTDAQQRALEAEPWVPRALAPAKWARDAEPRTSLALLKGDEVVGWMLTHELDARRLQYSSGWVRDDLQRLAHVRPFLRMLADSGERADAAGYELGVWYVSAREQRMAAFTLTRMARLGGRITETMRTHKSLGPHDLGERESQAGHDVPLERGDFEQLL